MMQFKLSQNLLAMDILQVICHASCYKKRGIDAHY